MYIHIYLHVFLPTLSDLHQHIYIYMQQYIYIYIYTYIRMYTNIHIYIYIYVLIHIYTYSSLTLSRALFGMASNTQHDDASMCATLLIHVVDTTCS